MRTAPYIHNLWNVGGPFIGVDAKANTVVTIQSPFDGDVIHAVNAGNYRVRGEPLRWYQDEANDQVEIEVPNVKSVTIDRSIDQDAATCEIAINNQWMYNNGAAPANATELGQPGYFTANRGASRDALARWGITPNEWQNAFVTNALLRTYQGYGGYGKTLSQAIADGNLILTGVWLVDTVTSDISATLTVKCRDMAKLLIEQQLYLPLIPADHYPLKYYRWDYVNDAVRAGTRVVGADTPTAVRAISYSDSSSDRWYGFNADIHGHHPLDATDGDPNTYWLSVGNSYSDAPWATDWIEYNVGSDINAVTVNPWAGNYTMYVSIMDNGVWLGGDTIPYDPSYLFISQSPAVDTGANIPYVYQSGVPWETEQTYFLPAVYHADKVRVTFRNEVYTEFGPWHYRAGVREFSASVDAAGASSSVSYAPFFIAADTAASGTGYITADSFGDVDAFGDARRADYTGGTSLDGQGRIGGGVSCITMTNDGGGYYLMSQAGEVYCYGNAVYYSDPHVNGYVNQNGLTGNATELVITPSGHGYWIMDTVGFLFAFGDATPYPDFPYVAANGGLQWSSCDGTVGAQGLIAVRSDGVVLTKGAGVSLGNWDVNVGVPLGPENFCGSIRRDDAGTGYWLLSAAGDVQTFGTATNHGGITGAAASTDWHTKYWEIMPQQDGGYEILRGDGIIIPVSTEFYGQPIAGTTAQLRIPGNYLDYSDIIKDLALWSGFLLYEPALAASDSPNVFGNIESTGAYAPEPLPDTLFDKRPVIDAMHQLKETVGYILYVDDQGGFRFESPNWWGPGNFDEIGTHLEYVPEIDERVQLTNYSAVLSDDAQRSVIIISSEDPDQHFTSTITTTFVPTNAQLRGLMKPAMWINGFFQNPKEQRVMAELIALHIHFQNRQGQVAAAANPAIQINDQVRIWERQTGESYIHYVRGMHTTHDLESGVYTMTLQTHWLGDETEWAISNGTGSGFVLSSTTRDFLKNGIVNPPPVVIPPVVQPPQPPPPVTPPTGSGDGGPIPGLTGFGPTSFTDFTGITFTEQTSPFFPTTANQLITNLSLNMPNEGNEAVNPTNNGFNGYRLVNFRSINREGPRAAGAAISITNAFIEVIAQSGDHADCVQFFGGNGANISYTHLAAGGGGATCIFAADNSHGDITLDHCTFTSVPGQAQPGFLVRVNSDGADTVHVRHCRFEQGGAAVEIFIDPSKIVEWTDVCWLDGTPIPQP